MELRHLRYFVAAAEAENVTRAATKLRVAQPAVSRHIQKLEQELGTTLLTRRRGRIELSQAGTRSREERIGAVQVAQAAV